MASERSRAREFQDGFRTFLGDEARYRRFVLRLEDGSDPRYWQEQLWQEFVADASEPYPQDLNQARGLFDGARERFMPRQTLAEACMPAWCRPVYLGGEAPVQGEGELAGYEWYFRARGDTWSMQVAAKQGGELDIGCVQPGEYYHEEGYGAFEFDASYMPLGEARWFIVESLRRMAITRGIDLEDDPSQRLYELYDATHGIDVVNIRAAPMGLTSATRELEWYNIWDALGFADSEPSGSSRLMELAIPASALGGSPSELLRGLLAVVGGDAPITSSFEFMVKHLWLSAWINQQVYGSAFDFLVPPPRLLSARQAYLIVRFMRELDRYSSADVQRLRALLGTVELRMLGLPGE